MKKGQFTLIELIVVVGIIAILTTILMSVMKTSRERVEELTCVSKLKDIGAAFYAHSGDYGYFPGVANTYEYSQGEYWFNALAVYMDHGHVKLGRKVYMGDFDKDNPFTCDTARKFYDDGTYPADELTVVKNIMGYGMNCYSYLPRLTQGDLPGGGDGSTGRFSFKPRPAAFQHPSLLPLTGDAKSFTLGGAAQARENFNGTPKEQFQFDRYRHGGRGTLLIADGRVLVKEGDEWSDQMRSFVKNQAFFGDTDMDDDREKYKSF